MLVVLGASEPWWWGLLLSSSKTHTHTHTHTHSHTQIKMWGSYRAAGPQGIRGYWMCVCVCVCVCDRKIERELRKRKRGQERKGKRKKHTMYNLMIIRWIPCSTRTIDRCQVTCRPWQYLSAVPLRVSLESWAVHAHTHIAQMYLIRPATVFALSPKIAHPTSSLFSLTQRVRTAHCSSVGPIKMLPAWYTPVLWPKLAWAVSA